MTRKVLLAPVASDDLIELVESLISREGLGAAIRTNARLDAALESLEDHAERGRVVPELRDRGVTGFREVLVSPYRIIYRVEPRTVFVVAVVDHRRDLDTLLAIRARRS